MNFKGKFIVFSKWIMKQKLVYNTKCRPHKTGINFISNGVSCNKHFMQ